MTFDPKSIHTFRFVSCIFDETNYVATFRYAFDDVITFEEKLCFPDPRTILTQAQKEALKQCLHYLHLVLGISYYKAAVPPKIIIEHFELSEAEAHFYNKLYQKGLNEFAYRNQLKLHDYIQFPWKEDVIHSAHHLELPRRTLVPIGGGKDSLVTLHLLQSIDEPMQLFSLGEFDVTRAVSEKAKTPCLFVNRYFDQQLFRLNEQGALNGHVPISAIIAFILPIIAILYGFDRAALSNERSANVGNVQLEGEDINHQYSKSYEFEKDVSLFIKTYLLSHFTYFSMLRPFSDLHLARLFSHMDAYHDVFRSCNKIFRLNPDTRFSDWCCDCPKCRFTFLALAPFMQKERLIAIFHRNLLNDATQQQGYDALLGVSQHKPFECVGEIEESIAAFFLLSQKKEWPKDLLIQRFIEKMLPNLQNPEELLQRVFSVSDQHAVPKEYGLLLENN